MHIYDEILNSYQYYIMSNNEKPDLLTLSPDMWNELTATTPMDTLRDSLITINTTTTFMGMMVSILHGSHLNVIGFSKLQLSPNKRG
jgi:hypothetical protein